MKSAKGRLIALDLACIIIMIGMIAYTLYSIANMPENIPIHTTDGVVDGWGSKWISLILPGVIVAVYVLFSFIIKYLKKREQSITFAKWSNFTCVVLFAILNLSFLQFVFT